MGRRNQLQYSRSGCGPFVLVSFVVAHIVSSTEADCLDTDIRLGNLVVNVLVHGAETEARVVSRPGL